MMNIKDQVINAYNRIKPLIKETPLEYSVPFSKNTGCHIYLKCENLQHTNSFKIRGAFNKLLSLTPKEREQGFVAASTGNHGAALAFGHHQLKIPGVIFVPENAEKTKIKNIENYNIPLKYHGNDCMVTEMYARNYAAENNRIYISPYNDWDVVAGQGTIGIELKNQLDHMDAILVPIGGGGLISGIAGYIKETSPHIKIIGCLPENSPVMQKSIKAGHIIDMETLPTLSDATAGGIEPNAMTFSLCQKYVDDYILVSEAEIKNAIKLMIDFQHLLIEGAAALTIAAILQQHHQFSNKNVVAILSGANVSLNTLKSIL